MPSIQDATNQDLSAYTPITKSSQQAAVPSLQDQQPVLNPMIRCPLPPIFQSNPDSLRQYYQAGQVPQFRLLSPALTASGTIGGGTSGVAVITETTGGGGGTTPSKPPVSQQVSITTPAVNSGSSFVGSFSVAKGFQLLSISTTSPSRVRLYGTQQAQINDAYRGLDVPPPAGVIQNIICDVVLDTSPYRWTFQSRTGANGDDPQNATIYVSITNIDTTSDFITLTVSFVPLES